MNKSTFRQLISAMLLLAVAVALFSCEAKAESKSDVWWKSFSTNSYTFVYHTDDNGAQLRMTYCFTGGSTATVSELKNADGSYSVVYHSINDGSKIYVLDDGNKTYSSSPSQGVSNPLASFADYKYGAPDSTGEKQLNGETFFCETFGKNGNLTVNYFRGDELYAVESIQNGKTALLMYDISFSGAETGNQYLHLPSAYEESIPQIDTEVSLPDGFFDD